jgi:hypothetical protein
MGYTLQYWYLQGTGWSDLIFNDMPDLFLMNILGFFSKSSCVLFRRTVHAQKLVAWKCVIPALWSNTGHLP